MTANRQWLSFEYDENVLDYSSDDSCTTLNMPNTTNLYFKRLNLELQIILQS